MQTYKFFTNYVTGEGKQEEGKKKELGFQIRTPATLFFFLLEGRKEEEDASRYHVLKPKKREEKKKRKTKKQKKIHEDTLLNSIIYMGTVRGRDPT